jgi:hypothetical protein
MYIPRTNLAPPGSASESSFRHLPVNAQKFRCERLKQLLLLGVFPLIVSGSALLLTDSKKKPLVGVIMGSQSG